MARAQWSSTAKTVAVFAASSALALGLLKSYRALFPFRNSAAGVCMYCGETTLFGPRGWAKFCVRHGPLSLLSPVMIFGEALSLFAAAISLWLLLRALFARGVPRAFLWIVILCAAAMVVVMLLSGEPARLRKHFIMGVGLLLFVLTAAYVDSLESMVMVTAAALIISAGLALVIQVIYWILYGYMGIFA